MIGHKHINLNPAQVLSFGFAGIILIGALLLNLPQASIDGNSIGFIDALFTSASAVSVTGFAVVETATHWTLFGKIVIIILVQIGGLGIMTMATLIALLLGKKITLKERILLQEGLNQFSLEGVVKLTRYIIISTLAIEAIGAILLSTRFIPIYGFKKGIWFSIFHSISAFCNAGIDITGNSMVPFASDIIINLALIMLIITGGLGYSVYIDLTTNKMNIKKFSLHTRFVLLFNIILFASGFVFILVMEYNNPKTLGNLPLIDKIVASIFQAVNPRSAGFYSIDISGLTLPTTFLIIMLMFIGGSPGSTAGGIKTTTFGVLIITIVSVLKGKTDVEIFKKRIPNELIYRALAVIGLSFFVVILVTMILTLTDAESSFLGILFKATSTFATVGLSRGAIPSLSFFEKIVFILTMFAGRVGPLTLGFALARRQSKTKANFRYPEGKIMIG